MMDNTCIFISMESSDYFYNQAKLLLFSLRKYGGLLKDSFVFACVNDGGLSSERINFLETNFKPIKVVQGKYKEVKTSPCPKQPGTGLGPFARKYNFLNYFDMVNDFDRFIYLDCDILIGEDFTEILKPQFHKSFAARASGPNRGPHVDNYDDLLLNNFNLDTRTVDDLKETWKNEQSTNILPHFNAGLWMVDRFGLKCMSKYIFPYLKKCKNLFCDGFLKTEEWNREQTALSLVAITEIKNLGTLDIHWGGPTLYHNFKAEFGTLHYENPNDPLILSDYPKRKNTNFHYISKIVKEFNGEYHANNNKKRKNSL